MTAKKNPVVEDDVVATNKVYTTKNYAKFKTLPGNRPIDKRHVGRLKSKIEREGNLTPEFPIQVNENFEVIDGQHRLRACEELKQPISYEIKEHLNIQHVATLNTGQKNWTWQDHAERWAVLGNKNYQDFLELQKEFKQRFTVLVAYCTTQHGKVKFTQWFQEGDLQVPNYALARKRLQQYEDLVEASGGHDTRNFALAALRYMSTPNYRHKEMVAKVEEYGHSLASCYVVPDYISMLEAIWRR